MDSKPTSQGDVDMICEAKEKLAIASDFLEAARIVAEAHVNGAFKAGLIRAREGQHLHSTDPIHACLLEAQAWMADASGSLGDIESRSFLLPADADQTNGEAREA